MMSKHGFRRNGVHLLVQGIAPLMGPASAQWYGVQNTALLRLEVDKHKLKRFGGTPVSLCERMLTLEDDMSLRITDVETIPLQVPLAPRHDVHMQRLDGNWSLIEVWRLTTNNGLVGYGETIAEYTWGRSPVELAAKVKGRNPFDLLWDDSFGAGLQMALWDLAGKAMGVPCNRLLGSTVREAAPISWWCLDMDPDEWATEAQLAVSSGYTSIKLKGRAWRDVFAQIEAVATAAPTLDIDLDYNSVLANAGTAVLHLRELEQFPNVKIVETPIPQGDVAGNCRIRSQTRFPIAMHFGQPPIMTALDADVCDGFVVGGGVERVLSEANIAAQANKPFWLQLVGTGLTTAWAAQLGAVCTHAQWPAVTCMNIYRDDLIVEPLRVELGYVRVPQAPGLGVNVDETALEKYRLQSIDQAVPRSRKLYVLDWPSADGMPNGTGLVAGFENDLYREASHGNFPRFSRGSSFEQRADDGSTDFDHLYKDASGRIALK